MYVFFTMNSFRISFPMVPLRFSGAYALLLGRYYIKRHYGSMALFIVIRNRDLVERYLIEEIHVEDGIIATPAFPTSPMTLLRSES
jgi:hypothetical protein